LIIALGASCARRAEKFTSDADSTLVPVDTTALAFDPNDEFQGIGVPRFGDLDSMIKRRMIRALVPFTHAYYYIDGKERTGLAYEALNRMEKLINDELHFYPPKVRVVFIPVSRGQVIPLLREGYGDIGYAGIAITEAHRKLVDFSEPTITGLKDVIVASKIAPKLSSLADLAGKDIYLHPNTNYEAETRKLSDSLVLLGMPAINIRPIDPYLETEDIMHMLNSGVIPYSATVLDAARMWLKVMDSLVVYDQFPLNSNVSYGMVMRKGSPKLKGAADRYVAKNARGTLFGNILYNKYVKNSNMLPNMHNKKAVDQVRALRATFQRYGDKYRLDWLLLVAQGYQESRLQQEVVSPVGAIGIMQVLPSTAAGRPLYISNIYTIDNNVHAGVKYMRFLMDQYIHGPGIDSLNCHLLALASYNCGPSRVAHLRRVAKAKGLDENQWFNNVEVIAAQEIGRETVQYVSNIYKFYTSYKAMDYYQAQRDKVPMPKIGNVPW
jgi:membrane-bound lytic murein transglycosylase MltF